jgi:hypothetical protein
MSDSIKQAWEQRTKLYAEGDKLYAEGQRLTAESDKLFAEGQKLYAESRKLTAEGNLIFINAVIAVHGTKAIITYTSDSYTITAYHKDHKNKHKNIVYLS